MRYLSIMVLELLLTLHLAENVIFRSASPDSIGIAQFVCQFGPTSPYITIDSRFRRVLIRAGGLLPQTQCLEGAQTQTYFLLNEVEKHWLMGQLLDWEDPLAAHIPDGLKKLWDSDMGKDDCADFVQILPMF
jgi:hypothetical protein